MPVDTRDLLKIDRSIEMRSTATSLSAGEAPADSDGDGIPDSVDDFPNDPRRATTKAATARRPETSWKR